MGMDDFRLEQEVERSSVRARKGASHDLGTMGEMDGFRNREMLSGASFSTSPIGRRSSAAGAYDTREDREDK